MPVKILAVALIFILPIVPTFWALLDIPRRRFRSTTQKVVWFVAVATLPCIGAIFYILLARRATQPAETAEQNTTQGGSQNRCST